MNDNTHCVKHKSQWYENAGGVFLDILNGRYKLTQKVASDLLGVTWIAEDMNQDAKKLRLRILSLDATESEYVQNLIYRYIQLATFVHPNLVQAYELDVIRKVNNRTHPSLQYFYTSEYQPLEQVVSYQDLSAEEITEVVRQICYVLNYLHFRGHAYKYLNFNTLTITRDENGVRIKLADLPTTLHYREQLGAFSDEVEQFLPPEIIRDTDSNPTSDIYSLGVMLFYLHKGIPYQSGEFEGLSDEANDHDIYKLIEIMTVKNANERFSTILQFMEAYKTLYPVDFNFIDKEYYEKLVFTTPLVGRDRELKRILATIQQRLELRSDVRQVVIQGEPGIGKSRLLQEIRFYTYMRRTSCCIITLTNKQVKGHVAFKAILREIIGDANLSPELIKKYGSEIVKLVPEIADKWKVIPSDPLDEEPELMRLNNRIYNFIIEYTQSNPMVIFIDGLQNMNGIEFSILENLVRNRRKLPLLFVTTLRDESTPYYATLATWISAGHCESVNLNKFGFTEAAEYIQYIQGIGHRPIALAARIMGDAAGNPRMIEEAMKTLFMFEYLYIQEDRQWSDPSDRVKDLEFSLVMDEPADYSLDFFDPHCLKILACISIFDSPAPGDIFGKMLNLDEQSIAEALDRLATGKILNRKLGDWGYTYDFFNKRLRKKAQALLSPEEIRRYHEIAADYLEYLNAQGNEIISESLIYHLTSSGQLEKAASHAQRLAQQMEGMNHNRQAQEFYSLALRLLTDCGVETALSALMIKLGDTSLRMNDSEKAFQLFQEAKIYAKKYGQFETEMDARIRSCGIKVTMKEMSSTEDELNAVIAQCEEANYSQGEIEAVLVKCRFLLAFGRFDEIRTLIAPYLVSTREQGQNYYYGRMLNEKGICDIYSGRTSEAFMALLESDRMLEKTGNLIERTRPLNNLGILNFDYLGDLEKSREYFNKAIALSERTNTVWGLDMLYSNLAETYMKEDNHASALSYLNRACRLAEDAQHNDMLFYIYSNLCLTYLNCCQYDEAYRYLSKLDYEFLNRKGHALNVALYFLCHIRFSLDMRHFESALQWYRRAHAEEIHIPENLDFEYKLLKLKIDHLDHSNGNSLDLIAHLNALLKATTNPLEIRLIRETILDLATESMNDIKRINLSHLLQMDAELIDTFDTPRLRMRRALLCGSLQDQQSSLYNDLLMNPAIQDYPSERWLIYQAVGRRFDLAKDSYQALVNYYTAMDALRMMALRVPERYRESFILKDEIKVTLYRQLRTLIGRILSSTKGDPALEQAVPSDLQGFFEVSDEDRILVNQRFLNSVYKIYEKKMGVRFKNLEHLIQHYGKDEYQNILLTMKYMVQITFADRGFFFFSREFGTHEDVIATDLDSVVPDVTRFSVMLEFDSEGILIKNRADVKIANPVRQVSEALMVIPVRNNEPEHILTNRRRHESKEQSGKILGYIYLQSDKSFNNFTETSFQSCRILMRSLCILVENYHLKRTSAIDKLTSVFLRKHIESKLTDEFERSKANNQEMSIVMADIDHFKNVNDVYGHQKGDEVLREIGRLIRTNLRKGDLVGRYGGEEFILVLPETGDIDAYKVCEKIRRSIETTPLLGDQSPLTMSFGAASFPAHGVVEEELIEKADQALYESKHMGRNRTTVWTADIGVSKQRFDKLAGILEGNISTDSRKIQAMVDIMSLINRPIGREAKIYEILSQLVDICEAQSASLVQLFHGQVKEKFTRTVGVDGLDRKAEIAEELITGAINRGYGHYFVDWTDIHRKSSGQGVPDWFSYITVPMAQDGSVNGVLILSVSISKHEFDFNVFNYVNTLCGVISVILNEAER